MRTGILRAALPWLVLSLTIAAPAAARQAARDRDGDGIAASARRVPKS